jgi:hypothetical protein
MDNKFLEILHKNVNQSIDRLNDFRKECNESTFDSTISYLIYEIEYLKLLKEKRAINYSTDGRILNSDIYEVYDILDNKIFEGTIKQISKKYDLESGSIRTAYKRCSMLNKKFKFIKK